MKHVPGLRTSADRPVRVCFVIDWLRLAGTELQLLQLLQHLDRTRAIPYLCLLDGEDETSRRLEPQGVPVLRLGVKRLLSLHALRQAWYFRRFLKRHAIDVVQTYFPDSTRFAAPIEKSVGCKVFGSRRDLGHWLDRRDCKIARLYNRWFIDRIIANSEAARQSAIEQEAASPENVLVIPNGIDLNLFSDILPWNPKRVCEPQKIGMVGNLREVKGPDIFIRAAKAVLQEYPDAQFEIAGGGDIVTYQRLIDGLGLTSRVRLLGSIADVRQFLATLDLAVLPSRAEGLSNALLEYMAAGRPIVATDVGGNAALIEDQRNGVLIPPEDEHALSQAMINLLRNPPAAACLASAARQDSKAFDWRCAADRFARVASMSRLRMPTVSL
ncbi:MAG: glycosyltransferase [Thermoguttaceae bacterium]